MLKRLFQSYPTESEDRADGSRDNNVSAPLAVPLSMEPRVLVAPPETHATSPVTPSPTVLPTPPPTVVSTPVAKAISTPPQKAIPTPAPTVVLPPPSQDSFDVVYENAANKPPASIYGILKVAEMVASPHLGGMSAEVKRNCILMALDAAGAEIDYVLEDAVFRQRALNDHEDAMQKRIHDFESAKSDEIGKMQAELDGLTKGLVGRIQSSLDEVAREQEHLRVWQKRKQSESQRIADAAMYCVPKSSQSMNDGFATLLERGAAASWR